MLLRKTFLVAFFLLILSGCSSAMTYPESPNFNNKTARFQHPKGDLHDKSFVDLFKFFSAYFTRENDASENAGFTVLFSSKNDLANFEENVMWVGHSTLLLNHSELTIMTDPQFSGRASPFSFMGPKRVTPSPVEIADLPRIDVVVISHSHYDHLDEASIREIAKIQPNVEFLVPLGLKSLLEEWGAKNVTELDWWEQVRREGVIIQPTPVQHWSKRKLFDRNKTLWSGWMIQWNDFSFYFAGDTGYSDDFKETAKRLGSPDLAAIPIGAYEPREFMKSAHLNPEEAVNVFNDLGAKRAIGIHWGTFKLTLEPMTEPPLKIQEALKNAGVPEKKFRVLRHGEKWPAGLND
jgi:N-acyl-phosphatidylethanolamine-hydrolysing phospholipase D